MAKSNCIVAPGATRTSPSSRPARCARALDQSRPHWIEREIARRRHQVR